MDILAFFTQYFWFLIYLIAIEIIVYILTLIYQANRKQWGWFILTLLSNLFLIIYWIVWIFNKKLRKTRK